MNKKIFLILFIAILSTASVLAESTVTRSFSDNTPAQCSTLTVSLTVDADGEDTYYAIDEQPPAGWSISDPGTGDASDPGHIKWIVIENAEDTVYQYDVDVPCEALGSYSFAGTYMFESDTEEQTILGESTIVKGLKIVSLKTIYSDDTHYSFEFVILNNGTENLKNINWSLNTGLDTINSQQPLNLTANENTTVFVDYTYGQSGTYSVTATVTDGAVQDSETITVSMADLEVLDLSVINPTGMERTFEFVVKNYLSNSLNNVLWDIDFGDGNNIESTNVMLQSLENMSIFVDYTYPSADTYLVNASAVNGTLEGHNNITIIVT